MQDQNNQLEKFIERILLIKNSNHNKQLDDSDLENIARETGLSDSEWQEIKDIYNSHLTRGFGHVQYQNWDEAIAEFELALSLNPYNPEILFQLAKCYASRWEQNTQKDDKVKALEYAKQCLNISPETIDAIALISKLKKNHKVERPNKNVIIGISGIVIILIGIFIFLQIKKNPLDKPSIIKIPFEDTIKTKTIHKKGESYAVPVIFDDSENKNHFKLEIESSNLENFAGLNMKSFSYRLMADLIPIEAEITKLSVKLELIDANEKVVYSDIINKINHGDPSYRKGDIIPLFFIHYKNNEEPPDLKLARISIPLVNQIQAPTRYESSKKLESISWATQRPTNFNIEVWERLYTINNYSDHCYHHIVFEVINTGKSAIKNLKLDLQWFDETNKKIKSASKFITTNSNPRIKPGQTRISFGTWSVRTANKDLRIVIGAID